MSLRKFQKNPKAWVIAAVATSVVAVSLSVYNGYLANDKEDEEKGNHPNLQDIDIDIKPPLLRKKSKQYTNKSIALTLSHSILNSKLPLNDILLNSENVTFILPPNLTLDDLEFNMDTTKGEEGSSYNLPKTLISNYKLLNCSNLQGYFNILKNLKPDMLLVCSDDLGIGKRIPHDIDNFVKEFINIDQNKDDIYSKVAPIMFR